MRDIPPSSLLPCRLLQQLATLWSSSGPIPRQVHAVEPSNESGGLTGAVIASYAPLCEERGNIVCEVVPKLPARLVGILVDRNEPEITHLIEDVRAHPDRYPEPVRKAVDEELELLGR